MLRVVRKGWQIVGLLRSPTIERWPEFLQGASPHRLQFSLISSRLFLSTEGLHSTASNEVLCSVR